MANEPKKESPKSFQFSEGDPTEEGDAAPDGQGQGTWFNRALKSGLNYVKHYSERSGLKLLPELDLQDESTGDKKPAALKNAIASAQKTPQAGAKPQAAQAKPQATPSKAPAAPKPRAVPARLQALVDKQPEAPSPPPAPAPKEQDVSSSIFGDKPMFQTAIHAFVEQEKAKPATSAVRRSTFQGVPMYYTPPKETPFWIRTTIKVVVLAVLVGAGYLLETRYRVTETFSKLRYKQQLQEKKKKRSSVNDD